MPSDGGSGGGGDGGSSGSNGGNGGTGGTGGGVGGDSSGTGTQGGYGAAMGGMTGDSSSSSSGPQGFNAAKDSQAANMGFGNQQAYGGWASDPANSASMSTFAQRNPLMAAVAPTAASVMAGLMFGAVPGLGLATKAAVGYGMNQLGYSSAQTSSAANAPGNNGTGGLGNGPSGSGGNGPSGGGGGGGGNNWLGGAAALGGLYMAGNSTDPSLGGTLGSALGGYLAGTTGGNQAAVNAADPFASQRPQYQQQLAALMSNPGAYSQSPAAQAAINSGMGSIGAKMNSQGLAGSGAEQQALLGFATETASKDYYTQIQDLMQMSGANGGSPGTAGQLRQNQQNATTQGLGALGSAAGSALQNWWNSPSATDAAGGAIDMTGFYTPSNPIDYTSWAGDAAASGAGALGSGTYDTVGSLTDLFSF